MTRAAKTSASPVKRPRRRGRTATRRDSLAAVFIAPMKALGVTAVPPGDWRVEIKFDGYRAIATLNDGEVEWWSRIARR